ncbi:MAG: hydrogenase maturation nickel metallochaperone HypA [Chitinophagaceae bacterium]|nr:hydrogenase maturation nickel metallochaperone HypA [Chitinophagaceae bacterium]
MHEISLVRNIFSTLEHEFPERMDKVRGIYLTVGLLTNLHPLLMQSAFDAVLLDEPRYNKTSLHVKVLPIKIKCAACGAETEVQQYKFICAECKTPGNQVIQGEEMLITQVEFEDTE